MIIKLIIIIIHIHRALDSLVCKNHEQLIWSHASTDIDKAKLLAAASPHSGDWLAAPPITSVGLRLSDEQLRISVTHKLGFKACEPHTCGCGEVVDARGLPWTGLPEKCSKDSNAIHISMTSSRVP